MPENRQHAVYLFPQALETLGDAVKPHLHEGPHGPHFVCSEIDSGGPLFGMTIPGLDPNGQPVEIAIMIPSAMVQMVFSTQPEVEIGYT